MSKNVQNDRYNGIKLRDFVDLKGLCDYIDHFGHFWIFLPPKMVKNHGFLTILTPGGPRPLGTPQKIIFQFRSPKMVVFGPGGPPGVE